MPIDENGRIVCINHKKEPMNRSLNYNFLLEAEKKRKGGLIIKGATGIPVVVYVCKICGYLELYAAMVLPEWDKKQLYVKCKNDKCKRDFLSPIQIDEGSFEQSDLSNNSYQCYFCKDSNIYDKEDHFFK